MSDIDDLRGARSGELSVGDAAELFGRPAWAFRRELQALHDKHGDVLWKYSEKPNAKLWTSLAALRRVLPGLFEIEISPLDVLELRQMVVEHGKRITRLERRQRVANEK